MSRYISGEELMDQCKRPSELPGRGGFKDHEPDGSWLQRMKLENFHDERLEILKEERIEKLASLSTGVWDPERGKVVVIKNKGKFWKNMGHCVDGEKLLYPEEALFLVDQGVMEMVEEGRPMSLQELYHKLLPTTKSFDNYVVCSHLMRLGFIVRRNENIGEVPHKHNPARKRQRGDGDDDDASKYDNDDDNDGKMISSTKRLKSDTDISESVGIPEPAADARSPYLIRQDLSVADDIPNFFDIFKTSLDAITIDPSFLTDALPGLNLTRTLEFDVAEDRRMLSVIAKDHFKNPYDRKNGGAENWKQWKKLSRKNKVLQTRARVLWEDDDLRPLHDPDILCSPGETMRRLRGSKEKNVGDSSKMIENLQKGDSDEQLFDIFPPDSKFKKSNPGRPTATAVCVSSQSVPPLNMESLRMMRNAKEGGSSLMFGVVEGGEVSFFSYNLVSLPSLI